MLSERRFPAGEAFFVFPPQTPRRTDVPLHRPESYILI